MIATLLLPLLTTVVLISGQSEVLVISAPAGTFRGSTEWSPQGQAFTAFLGIPYAKPPVGQLRFNKPEPLPRIQGVYDATKRGPSCIQAEGIDLEYPSDEDCLYLNLFVPQQKDDSLKASKKVFFYIHGGGGFMGSANEFIPGELVTTKDIIVVTFNNRLAWLGFLKGDTPLLPGNQGMWDQLMALRWIKDNIRSFGGDPDDVTVSGHSFGSLCLAALSVTRQAKGLFTKGLLISGSTFSDLYAHNDSHTLLNYLSKRLGCQNDNLTLTVQCLRSLPAMSFALPIDVRFVTLFFTEDDELFPASIPALAADAQYLTEVGFHARDYLVSLTNIEGPIVLQGVFALGYDVRAMTPQDLTNWTQWPLQVSETVITWYRHLKSNSFLPAFNLAGDIVFAMPSFNFLQVFSSGNTDGGRRSFFMLLDHMPAYMPQPYTGFYHALDLAYIFDLDPVDILKMYYKLDADRVSNEEETKMHRVYQGIVADFITTGDPGLSLKRDLAQPWPPYTLDDEFYLNFDLRPSVQQFPMVDRRTFWTKKFPRAVQEFRAESMVKNEL